MRNRPGMAARIGSGVMLLAVLATSGGAGAPAANPLAQFDLPDSWEARFWSDPDVKRLQALDAKALAALVPVQAGVRYCRCPACDATEAENSLSWSVAKPKVVTCRRCGVSVPNDQYPAKNEKEKKVPEDVVEVLPRVTHHYPYHVVEDEKQRYPDEHLYLAAKCDYEAREFLSKAALYAAVRYYEAPPAEKDPALARLASVLILRFAQVYPAYATHYDQPNSPKVFQQADLPPPYRLGYGTGKWEWTASLDVPLNLAIAYALVRDDPALAEAGRLLGDRHPAKTIERDLFRASAEFVRLQPEEYGEMSLQADRGLLAVGRLLNDPALVHEALTRLEGFAERSFYYDGLWCQGEIGPHRRILAMIDGWLGRLLAGYVDPPGIVLMKDGQPLNAVSGAAEVPMLALARGAGAALLGSVTNPEVLQASWPSPVAPAVARGPILLGGAGVARLAVGEGAGAIDLELRGQDSIGAPHFQRLALRLAVGGRLVLGDLDDLPATPTGWDRATASHNTVVVDGLNQRELPVRAAEPALGGDFVFFAADPDFQVAVLDDPRAYPQSTTRYRQTLIAASGARASYAVSVFEVHGGLQHDQVFHAAAGAPAQWKVSVPMTPRTASLLPSTVVYVPTARAEDGRWFVQAYGEFSPQAEGRMTHPATALQERPDGAGVRLHIMGDMPLKVVTATSPDPSVATDDGPGRAGLILRHRSKDGATLHSTFVTVFEPTGGATPLGRVGRMPAPDGTVSLTIETEEGPEHLVVNLEPGTVRRVTLSDGRRLATDGHVVRVSRRGVMLAGGTYVTLNGSRLDASFASGTIRHAVRSRASKTRGWFETDAPLENLPALVGRVVHVRHGDGTTRGWTIERAANLQRAARLQVREEPGFTIDSRSEGEARYYQFPRRSAPGPHRFHVSTIVRSRPPEVRQGLR